MAVTIAGNAATDGGSVELGNQTNGVGVSIVCTVSGLTGASVYVSSYAASGGCGTPLQTAPELIVVGSSTTSTASTILSSSGTGAVTITSTYGDGSFGFDVTWTSIAAASRFRGRARVRVR